MRSFSNSTVARIFDAYPPAIRSKLLTLRALIFATAANTAGVGEIEETLKWGEPAYLTIQSRSGSTIRIGAKKSNPTQYAIFFNCKTDLIETFRTLFPDEFQFDGNRAIVFDVADEVPMDALKICIAATLTYHRNKTTAR
ncbi:DUF1801 domain-containing protein [Pseudolysobacter antarcticus]|uniref:DUF1801 domain-containing protein n=1 Tax=Pseudolysobacter antarcticus TaxID=2511995 RepID=A0A411HFQ7_9GAMM|nr:DUF1801 domain-containing protein [Pseudolysobacter antarcticus]QBB69311.1 DUF1801 domain-containing protein [Pseudolysobacter antarcticus]